MSSLESIVSSYTVTTGLNKPLNALHEHIQRLYDVGVLSLFPNTAEIASRNALLGQSYLNFRITHILYAQNVSYSGRYIKSLRDAALETRVINLFYDLIRFGRFHGFVVGTIPNLDKSEVLFNFVCHLESHPKRNTRDIEQALDQFYRMLLHVSRTFFTYKEVGNFSNPTRMRSPPNRTGGPPSSALTVPPPPPPVSRGGRSMNQRVAPPPMPNGASGKSDFRKERYFSPDRDSYSPNRRSSRRSPPRGGGGGRRAAPSRTPQRKVDRDLAFQIMDKYSTLDRNEKVLEIRWKKFIRFYEEDGGTIYDTIEKDFEREGYSFTHESGTKYLVLPRKDRRGGRKREEDYRNEWEDSD